MSSIGRTSSVSSAITLAAMETLRVACTRVTTVQRPDAESTYTANEASQCSPS